MRRVLFNTIALCIALAFLNNHYAQNPNWVMPGGFFTPAVTNYAPLPQSPAWPPGVDPEDYDHYQNFRYQGERAQYLQAGYTGSDGQLMCFVVDGHLYDKNGWLVNAFRGSPIDANPFNWTAMKGYSEMLILPMGNSCERFAIIYMATPTDIYFHSQVQGAIPDFYMAIYNTTMSNNLNPFASGALEGQSANGLGTTLENISGYYKQNIAEPNEDAFSQRAGFLMASTELIDNCFRYVMLTDGRFLFRYKLSDAGLEYDDYKYELQNAGSQLTLNFRTEMEMIKMPNQHYRLAVPTIAGGGGAGIPTRAIRIYDLNPEMEIITGSEQMINLSGTAQSEGPAEPVGVEFDATGQYLYFTHTATPTWPKPHSIWQVQNLRFLKIYLRTHLSMGVKRWVLQAIIWTL